MVKRCRSKNDFDFSRLVGHYDIFESIDMKRNFEIKFVATKMKILISSKLPRWLFAWKAIYFVIILEMMGTFTFFRVLIFSFLIWQRIYLIRAVSSTESKLYFNLIFNPNKLKVGREKRLMSYQVPKMIDVVLFRPTLYWFYERFETDMTKILIKNY